MEICLKEICLKMNLLKGPRNKTEKKTRKERSKERPKSSGLSRNGPLVGHVFSADLLSGVGSLRSYDGNCNENVTLKSTLR